jgi:hypothetical protein
MIYPHSLRVVGYGSTRAERKRHRYLAVASCQETLLVIHDSQEKRRRKIRRIKKKDKYETGARHKPPYPPQKKLSLIRVQDGFGSSGKVRE